MTKENTVSLEWNRYDELTGILNRTGFYEKTEEILKNNPDENYMIVYWNVQKFKVINELFGRAAGDAILCDMAQLLRNAFAGREGAYARLERDNFVLCFPASYIEEGTFCRNGEIIYKSKGTEYHFISCYGLYKIEDKTLEIGTMVDRSRLAMDKVKNNYLKTFCYYDDSMRQKLLEEQELMNDAPRAIDREEFEVYYQPACDAATGKVIAAEALVRWNHPLRGMVSPGMFIPVFEKNGFISELDRYVWNKACEMVHKRQQEGKSIVPVSVNLSRVDFYNHSLCEEIQEITKKHGVKPSMLRIEITESAYSNHPLQVLKMVDKLHEYGFSVLMDDFGSGYSSLNTLKDLAVDILKMDMKFMSGIKNGERKASIIMESVIRMAKRMDLKTVAEGVETKEELAFLQKIGCDVIQGYYFYRPMPGSKFEELLAQKTLIEEIQYKI